LWIFGALAEDVWTREGFSWDAPILGAIHAHATPALDRLAIAVTTIGSPVGVGVHYPSDVLAAWVAALAWVVGLALILRARAVRRERWSRRAARAGPSPERTRGPEEVAG